MAQPYQFPQKREQSYDFVDWVIHWFEQRADVEEVRDLQDDSFFFYKGDLLIARSDGGVQFVEVKCESSYTRATTPNLAIERFSSIERQSPGGPWSTDADFYAHIYTDGLLVIMNRKRLVAWLESELARDPHAFSFLLMAHGLASIFILWYMKDPHKVSLDDKTQTIF